MICTCIWSCRITKRLILSYLILSCLCLCTVGILGIASTISLSHLFLSIICSISWVGEQCQEGWSETLALTQHWYAVTEVEAGRGGSRTRRETQDWLIETGVRTRDQTLTQNSHMKRPPLPRPLIHILSIAASLCFHFVSFFCLRESAPRLSVKSLSPKWYVCVWVSLCCECLRWPCRYYSPVAS